MIKVKFTDTEHHPNNTYRLRFESDGTGADHSPFSYRGEEVDQWTIPVTNLGIPIYAFTGDDGTEVHVDNSRQFELNMTSYFFQLVAGVKAGQVVDISCAKPNGKWEYKVSPVTDEYVPTSTTTNTSSVESNYVDVKSGQATVTPQSKSTDSGTSYQEMRDKKSRIDAEGKVRHCFTIEAFKKELDIDDPKVRARIETATDYVMSQRDPDTKQYLSQTPVEDDLPF